MASLLLASAAAGAAAQEPPAAPPTPGAVTVTERPAPTALPEPALASARLSLLAAGAVPVVVPPPTPEKLFAGARAKGVANKVAPLPAAKPAPRTAAALYLGGTAVTGRIAGQPFRADSVTLHGRTLTLTQGRGWVAERQLVVLFSPRSLPTLGQEYVAAPKGVFTHAAAPHVLTSWLPPTPAGAPRAASPQSRSKSYLKGFILRLRYDSLEAGKLRGRISVSLPGGDYAAGGFVADVR